MTVVGTVVASVVMYIILPSGQVIVAPAEGTGTPPPLIVQNNQYWQGESEGQAGLDPLVDDQEGFGDESPPGLSGSDDPDSIAASPADAAEILHKLRQSFKDWTPAP